MRAPLLVLAVASLMTTACGRSVVSDDADPVVERIGEVDVGGTTMLVEVLDAAPDDVGVRLGQVHTMPDRRTLAFVLMPEGWEATNSYPGGPAGVVLSHEENAWVVVWTDGDEGY